MTNRLMLSVAVAALIAGTSFANAQGTGHEGTSAGPAAQQSAPPSAGTSGTVNHDAAEPAKPSAKPSPGMKATQSEPKSPAAGKNDNAQGDMKAGPTSEKSAQDNNMKGEKSKSMSSETNEKGAPAKDMKAEGNEGRNGNMKADSESKGTAENRSQTTTGQAGAGAKLSTEQRTKITTVIRDQHVAPVNDVNFAITIGTRVPREVSFHPLPAEIVTYYPEWRGYEYFLVRDQIIVVDPRTFEIVAVLEA